MKQLPVGGLLNIYRHC